MQPLLILQLLLLLAVANGTPILAKLLLGDTLDRPLDGGAIFTDGRPWFGPAKTIRGIVLSLLATSLAAALIGLPWRLGAVVAGAAMAGDLLSSFVKRSVAPSGKATGLDQIPEALLPLVASRLVVAVTFADIVAGTMIAFVGGMILSRILFALRLRDQPF